MRVLESRLTMITVVDIRDAISRVQRQVQQSAEDLSTRDGQLGDGDLGITLEKAFNRLTEIAPTLPNDLGKAFAAAAAAISKVSSSSFGTLLATGLLAAAKQTLGKTEIPSTAVPDLLRAACQKMSARGFAALGDKTVLDTIDAAARALDSHPEDSVSAVITAVDETLALFRGRECKIGRARIFADRSIGLDDPGMVAFRVMVGALKRS
jgi:phosphoenolpyruvate---glycerone phosphotransferase subunit DhaL